MKRIKDLYEKIISLDNLRLADEKARRRKLRSYGVKIHDKSREANILALHETLKIAHSKTLNIAHSRFMSRKKGSFSDCRTTPTVFCTMR